MKKKIMALVIAAVMAVMVLPGAVFAAEAKSGDCGDSAKWAVSDDGVLTISGTGSIKDYEATYTGEIKDGAAPWIEMRDSIKEIVIEEGITAIGKYAFMGMDSAEKLTLPEGVTEISDYAFDGCNNLEEVKLPESVKKIGLYAFHSVAVTEVTIPANVEEIGILAFGGRIVHYYSDTDFLPGDSVLKEIKVDEGNRKFFSDNGVLYEKLPDGGCSLSMYPGAKEDKEYTVLEGTTQIGDYSFFSNMFITELTVPEGVKTIGEIAFFGCGELKTVKFPKSLTAVAEGAFPESDHTGVEPDVADIYYNGTEADWQKVAIGEYNDALLKEAKIHYGDEANADKPDEITVYVNGNKVSFDQPPIIKDDRTLVPMRAIFEAMGAKVDWEKDTKTVKSEKGNDSVSIKIGEKTLYKNGTPIEIDVPAQIVNDRTLVPIRAISEAYGCKVDWDGAAKKVTVETVEEAPENAPAETAEETPAE
ncbi:MAG: leucine-rich repeat protein [Firmicutes bacterium]|nr:leucine-rich repeat protein [Bacillota bacterium]